jgi:hypothetical protein
MYGCDYIIDGCFALRLAKLTHPHDGSAISIDICGEHAMKTFASDVDFKSNAVEREDRAPQSINVLNRNRRSIIMQDYHGAMLLAKIPLILSHLSENPVS